MMDVQYIKPQLARPFISLRDNWMWESEEVIAEYKYDGHRLLLSKDRQWSRVGKERHYVNFLHQTIYDGILLDGELLSLNPKYTSTNVSHLIVDDQDQLKYVVFDIMTYSHSNDIMNLPWHKRRKILEGLPIFKNDRIQLSDVYCGNTKQESYNKLIEQGAEGIIFKLIDAPYESNSRKNFIKYKHFETYDVVIIDANSKPSEWTVRPGEIGTDGILYPEGKHSGPWLKGYVNLSYGYYNKQGNLIRIGSLGVTGPPEEMNQHIGKVAEVKGYGYADIKIGSLRHPIFLHWRDPNDKEAKDCVYDFQVENNG